MLRPSIGAKPMTTAERQARYRAARAASTPAIRTHRPADHRSRARRWLDTVAALVDLEVEYVAWLEALPANLRDSATADALQAICDLDRTAARLRS
jgi:hypothetical protein